MSIVSSSKEAPSRILSERRAEAARRRAVSARAEKLSRKIRPHLGYDGDSCSSRGKQPSVVGMHGTRSNTIASLAIFGRFDKSLSSDDEKLYVNPNQHFKNKHQLPDHIKNKLNAIKQEDPEYDPMLAAIEYADSEADSVDLSVEHYQESELSHGVISRGVIITFTPMVINETTVIDRDGYGQWEMSIEPPQSLLPIRDIIPVDGPAADSVLKVLSPLR